MIIYFPNQLGYNEPRPWRTDLAGPKLFVLIEFHCVSFQIKLKFNYNNYQIQIRERHQVFVELFSEHVRMQIIFWQ